MTKTIKLSLVASLLTTTVIYAKEDLGTITVTSATKSEQSIKDITSNVEVITGVELEEKNIKTVAEALNLVSGVSFTSNGGIGGATSLNLRGASNNRTLILIDGVRYKDHSSISGTDIANLMVIDIKQIEIIKGAQSGIWGADASAGVINILTKEPKDGFSGSLLLEGGSFNTQKYGLKVSQKNDTLSISADATRLTSDSFTTKLPSGDDIDQYEDDSYKNETYNIKTNYFVTDDITLKLKLTQIDSLKEYDVSGADDIKMKNDSQSKSYNLAYNQRYNNHKFTIKYDNTNIKRDQIGTTWGVKLTDNTNDNIEFFDKISYNKKDFVLLGAGSSSDKMNYEKADGTQSDAKNNSKFTYITNSNKLDKLILTESLRYDDYDNFSGQTTGKVGAKYNLTNAVSLFSNLGTSYSVPLLVKNINPWGETNMDIKPEESKSYDIGFRYKDLKINYFYQKITNLIDWYDPTPSNYYNNDAIYKNLDGESILKGLELDYKQEIVSNTLLSINYTRLSAKDKDKKDLARRAKQNVKFGIDYYGISKLHLGLNGEYVGERFDKADNKGTQTGRYTVAHFVTNYEVSKELKVYGKIENITNKYYQTTDGYATSPRAYYAGIQYSF